MTGLNSSSLPATYATPSASSAENSSAIKLSRNLKKKNYIKISEKNQSSLLFMIKYYHYFIFILPVCVKFEVLYGLLTF